MNSTEKLKVLRKMYIQQVGKEPKSVILGYEVVKEIKAALSHRYVDEGVEILGMKVFIDHDKPHRVEVGNMTV